MAEPSPHPSAPQGSQASRVGTDDGTDASTPLVLVVDDNPVTRYSTVRLLRAAGFRTMEADCGERGVQLADSSISVVVLDVHLPDMTGFDVCERIRSDAETATLPVIHLSAAYVAEQDKVKGLDAGANAYLTHPVEPRVLIATVGALVRAQSAERELRRSEARLRAIYEQAVGGICLLSGDGRFLEVNPAVRAVLERPAEELVGREVAEFASPHWRERVRAATVAGDGDRWQGTLELVSASDQTLHLEWSISARLPSGERVAVVSDVTERVNLEAQREQLLEREQVARTTVERLNRMKDEFIAILSHELRNPLNVISVWSQILAHHLTSDESRRGLEAIGRSVQIQQRLVADLVDVSALNVGKMKLEREISDPAPLILSAVEGMQGSADEKEIKVVPELHGLPSRQWLDPGRFQQMIWNLLSNAIKFSPRGTVVRIEAGIAGGQLVVRVIDQGSGIAPDFLPYLFDRFTQSEDASSRRHRGLGLGLAIVRQLADLHGGDIHAQSDGENKGATFELTIPLVDTVPLDSAEGATQLFVEQAQRIDGLSVLIVEDDDDAAQALASTLRATGAVTRVANDYEKALSLWDEQVPDLIVSDIGLPDQDGYTLIRALRMREVAAAIPRVPAVALTAFTREQDRQAAMEAGFDAQCGKPMRREALLRAIAQVLKRGRAADTIRATTASTSEGTPARTGAGPTN